MAGAKANAVVGMSGGPTAVINQSFYGLVTSCLRSGKVGNVYGALHGVKGIFNEDFVDLGKETAETLQRVADTPSSALFSVRKRPTEEECARVFEVFRAHDIRFFFYIGGNDTAETLHIVNSISEREGYDLRAFHIPKTIDNDLLVTDHCPGYGSAAKFVACGFMGDNLDNRSLPGIKVNVTMGRHAGFLTAASILARQQDDDGPHLIYLPEVDFDMDRFIADVERVFSQHKRCIVAVSEGIHTPDGQPVVYIGGPDDHDNPQLSGSGALGDLLARTIKERLGEDLRVRADTFGYLQRCFPGVVSDVDAREARIAGETAAEYATRYDSGSVAFRRTGNGPDYGIECFLTPLHTVAKHTKSLPRDYIADGENDVKESYREYVEPLVGELPDIGRLAIHRVPKRLEG